ncbi:succinylglutamate desuccinylase/aspartoacylase family protein [Limibacillus sp. MBR-115]|uniref:succinylglutamate desuccinylase/aspartoacylase family protein n=1 Tax=Limibacillus sp. MBR-115 TaxID=3156465 RepID=UPI003392DE58
MAAEVQKFTLAPAGPGSSRELFALFYGKRNARKKAYIQAAIHADETPALLVAHHLRRLLDQAAGKGRILGQVVLVPFANPIGLSQIVNDELSGRYEVGGKGNFNRNWPDLFAVVEKRLDGLIGEDPVTNQKVFRTAVVTWLNDWKPNSEMETWRKTLLGLAYDADIVLDLHCDDDALMHLFIAPQSWPDAADLAADLGCAAVMTAEDSGGGSFDECFSAPWTKLARAFPDANIPAPPLSATVELRGRPDVDDATAEKDALAIFKALQRRGIIDGEAPPPAKPICDATDLRATEILRAPMAGVVSYKAALGQQIKAGDLIAEIVDPAADTLGRARVPLHAGTNGVLLSKRQHKWAVPGFSIAKIVGEEILEDRVGVLLENR